MIPLPTGTKIWVACGATDMRRGFDGLAMMVQDVLKQNPYGGRLFVFRGKRADRINQGAVVGRHRAVSLCETARAGKVRLAADARGNEGSHLGAVVDTVRGN